MLANSFKPIVGLNWSPFVVGCVVFGVYSEFVRGGVLAVPVTARRTLARHDVVVGSHLRGGAYALRVALANWTGLTPGVMKDTSLVLWAQQVFTAPKKSETAAFIRASGRA